MPDVDRMRRTPLHYAAAQNDRSEVVRLVVEGEDPNSQDASGYTPLHLAALEFALDAAEELLMRGAIVDVPDSYGNTPLWTAVFNSQGRGEMILLLRRFGADPNWITKSGKTPTSLASIIGNYDITHWLTDSI